MVIGISRNIAQNIVETVKDYCGYDINFIDTDGYIFASTNKNRIGDYHEIGKKVADTGQTIEVSGEDDYSGTQPGINAPFLFGGQVAAVIGITGEPDKVRRYSELASRITLLIFRENEYAAKSIGLQTATNYIIRSLVSGDPLNKNQFNDFMASKSLDPGACYRTAVIMIHSRYNPANISLIEQDIIDTVSIVPRSMYRFQYPNEYVLIFESSSLAATRRRLQKLLDRYVGIIRIAIGSEEPVLRQNRSYDGAMLSLKCVSHSASVALYEEFDLELILGSLGENVTERYLTKTIGQLTGDEIQVLTTYFENDMSLKDTSEKLFIHKNTLQYRLDKIYEKCSYNPRAFHDANILYLALKLQELKE